MEPYIENQKFPSYIKYTLFALNLVIAYITINASGTDSFNYLFFVALLPTTIILFAFIKATLRTHIDGSGIEISFSPFFVKKTFIGWGRVEEFSTKEYKPFKEFLGWGISRNRKTKAYTVKGTKCIEIKLKKGGRIIIGTQNPEEAIRKMEVLSSKN